MTQAESIDSINPSTEEIRGSYQLHTEEQIDKTLHEAQKTFGTWREETFSRRSDLMGKAASCLRQNIRKFVNIQTVWIGPSTR